jgi:hypothetical protein
MRPCADILSGDLPDTIRIVSGEHSSQSSTIEVAGLGRPRGSGDSCDLSSKYELPSPFTCSFTAAMNIC